MSEHIYDFIIAGAGSAGCVLANRLSADPGTQVLLLEAGGEDSSQLIRMPLGIGRTLMNPKLCWYYMTVPDIRAGNQGYPWLRGKLLGGTSSINGMLYFHGQPEDYDGWEALGCEGWGWDAMAASFKAIEDHELGQGPWRGTGGPLHVSVSRQRSRLTQAVIAAGAGLGLPVKQDLNEPDQEGIGYSPATIFRQRRWSAADAFLHPVRHRANLTVRTQVSIDRVLFEGQRAIGVVSVDGERFSARREVILAAGALNSPLLLQRSGIGDGELLRRHGIVVQVDRPAVGQNLREHKSISMNVALRGNGSHNPGLRGWRLGLNLLRYALRRPGALSSTYEVSAFLKTQPGLTQPDAELMMWAVTSDAQAAKLAPEAEPAFLLLGYPLRTESAGSIEITAAAPEAPPHITANFMVTEHDRAVTIGLFRFMRNLIAQPELAALVRAETFPGPAVQSDADIIDYCLRGATCFHAVGSCRMGGDADAVTDPGLRVRGVQGLRVVDCSVMPTQVSGNTNGPVMALAWHAADIILAEQLR